MLKVKKIDKCLIYIYLLIIITFKTSIWFRTNMELGYLLICLLGVYFLSKIIKVMKKSSFDRLIIFILIYINLVFIVGIFQLNNKDLFIIDFGIIGTFLFISNIFFKEYNIDKYDIFYKIIMVIISISIFFYFFGSILNLIKPSSYFELIWGRTFIAKNYYNLHYSYQTTHIGGILFDRNSSIFLEPAIYSFFISFAAIIECFYNNKNKKINIILIVLASFTTFSTIGISMILIIVTIGYFLKKSKSELNKILKILIIPLIVVLVATIIYYFVDIKINNSSGNKSYDVRIDDIKLGIEAFSDHKIRGWGYQYSDDYKSRQSTITRGTDISGGSNGVMLILYQGGIILSIFYIIGLYYIYKNNLIKVNSIFTNMFFVYLIVYFLGIPIVYYPFIISLIMDGLAQKVIYSKQ